MEKQREQPVAASSTALRTDSELTSSWQRTLNQWMPPFITLGLILGVARAVLVPLFQKTSWMVYEEDDFFYYLKIAQNLARGAGSTFNGIVPTNGYHPLWLLVLTAFSLFTTKPKLILLFLGVCIFASTLATYLLARAILRLSSLGSVQTGGVMASALAAYIALYSFHLFTGGMEVILTIPLGLAVLLTLQHTAFWQRGVLQSACLALLVSAMVLSRLDTLMFAALLLLSLLLQPETRTAIRTPQIVGFVLGAVPLALYFLSNRIWFHTWLPISGIAKQLKFNHLPSSPAFHSLTSKTPAQLINVVPVLLAILLLPVLYKRLTAVQRAIYPVVLLFPFLYLVILSCLSDWKLWDWYFYSFRIALCVAFAMFCVWPPTAKPLRTPIAGLLASLVVILLIYKTQRPTGGQQQLLEVAEGVRDFAQSHPGVYAMGDRSGMVGYLLPQPMVQTEGLVMDPAFVADIRQQLPLRSALGQYGVRYYIATSYPPYAQSCVHAVEPQQAGPASPHMTAEFCQPPAATIEQAEQRTRIFDLQTQP